MNSTPDDDPGGAAGHSLDSYDLSVVDWILAVLAAPLLLFVLMFATSGTVAWLARPAMRRSIALAFVALEAVAVWRLAMMLS